MIISKSESVDDAVARAEEELSDGFADQRFADGGAEHDVLQEQGTRYIGGTEWQDRQRERDLWFAPYVDGPPGV